jgi:hypothetical protein
MSIETTTPRRRAAISLLALGFLLTAHAAVDGGTLPHLIGLAVGTGLLLLLARAAVASGVGWPVGRT